MKPRLLKYQIGLGIVAVFTAVIVVAVLLQAGNVRQDKQTYDKANSIADKINTYFYTHSTIPESISSFGVKDAPDTVRYSRLSAAKFKFCVTYKSSSEDFNAGSLYGFPATAYYDDSITGDDSGYLYVSSSHKKGENCQTISPLSVTVDDSGSSSSAPFDFSQKN